MKLGPWLGLLLLGGLGVFLLWQPQASREEATGELGPNPSSSRVGADPQSCGRCHPAVLAEWQESMHALAFTDPQVRAPDQSDDFRKTECLPCHAAAPVFGHGIEPGTRVLARTARRHDGIDCLSCHGLPEGGVAASRAGLEGACQPSHRAALGTQALCAPCHDQHGTHQEWRASPAAAAGQDCGTCHLPRVARDAGEAGGPRAGRSHRMFGGRDREFALAGLELHASTASAGDRRQLSVELHNRFAGHNLPTDSRNRALDLVVTLLDARGLELPAHSEVGVRHPGGETGSARLRFRNPYRSEGAASTQIPAGEAARLDLTLPPEAHTALVELFYKLQPWIPDSHAHWSHSVTVELDP